MQMQMQKGYIRCAISKSHVSTSGDLYNDEGYREWWDVFSEASKNNPSKKLGPGEVIYYVMARTI